MKALPELLAEQFYTWELWGRSWFSVPYPVELEPPFRPFPGYALPKAADDGRRHTFFSRLAEGAFGSGKREERVVEPPLPERLPERFHCLDPLVEFVISVPGNLNIGLAAAEAWLLSLRSVSLPLSFELIGTPDEISIQLACREGDAPFVESQLRTFFPGVATVRERDRLLSLWEEAGERGVAVEFGLAREFMVPLGRPRGFDPDPYLSLFGVLATLGKGEAAVVQVLFQAARAPWKESIIRATSNADGKSLFAGHPELSSGAREKAARPLFAACLRVAVLGDDQERAWRMTRDLAGALSMFGSPASNTLVPLPSEEEIDLGIDILERETHRSGMLLGSDELLSLVHLPSSSVRVPLLRRSAVRTKAPPPEAYARGFLIGENTYQGQTAEVHLPDEARLRHVHLVGGSGTGKSTLLLSLITQDIEAGRGVAVLDPHGDLIDAVTARIPEGREGDVILFDPSDEEALVGWNILSAQSELERTLIASDLVALFRRFSTSWGDQMTSVLANAVLVFLEREEGGTLLDLRRFIADPDFRKRVLEGLADEHLRYFWQREFPLLTGGKSQGPILTRLDTFLRSKLVRRILAERESRVDFRGIVDGGKVFLAKLSQGAIGEENAALLGSLLVSKFHQVALSRQDVAAEERRAFFLYVDECQHFATASMAGLLSGARKYRLALTAAHQELGQLRSREPEVLSALLANAGTRVVFRVSEEDARHLEKGFSFFEAADLVNLGVGEAICRIGRSEDDFNLRTRELPAIPPEEARRHREELVARTRERFPVRTVPFSEAPSDKSAQATFPEVPFLPRRKEEPPPVRPEQQSSPALGRGGPEHQYLQQLLKLWGEARGFKVTLEQPVLDGRGSVDAAFEREGWRLACEISITSTVEQEVGNVEKCLAAGFDEVAVVSPKERHLAKLRDALAQRLSGSDMDRVRLCSPEELCAYLDTRPALAEKVETVGGYRVKVNYGKAPRGEDPAKAVAGVIARRLKKLKAGKQG